MTLSRSGEHLCDIAGNECRSFISSYGRTFPCNPRPSSPVSSTGRAVRMPSSAARGLESIMLELLADPQIWIAFFTLTALELVLGIDNIIFLTILVDKLPPERREFARKVGLFFAMFTRIALLLVLAWIVGLTAPLFTVLSQEISGRDLVLILGGLFLLWKSVGEIHEIIEGASREVSVKDAVQVSFAVVIMQVMLIDIVFSLDSIITAVGMVDEVAVMVAAVIASVSLMMVFAGAIGRFVSSHPTIKMLALAFLVAIGVMLIAEGFDHHVPKGYVYSAMAFSLVVEMLNIRMKKSIAPVNLVSHAVHVEEEKSRHSATRNDR